MTEGERIQLLVKMHIIQLASWNNPFAPLNFEFHITTLSLQFSCLLTWSCLLTQYLSI